MTEPIKLKGSPYVTVYWSDADNAWIISVSDEDCLRQVFSSKLEPILRQEDGPTHDDALADGCPKCGNTAAVEAPYPNENMRECLQCQNIWTAYP